MSFDKNPKDLVVPGSARVYPKDRVEHDQTAPEWFQKYAT